MSEFPYSSPTFRIVEDASDIFLAIREIIVMNKLAGRTDFWGRDLRMVASGDQLMNHLCPGRTGFASYYLQTIRDELAILENNNLIAERRRMSGPSGYGDDQEYMITAEGLQMCEGKNSTGIRSSIRNKMMARMSCFRRIDY